MITATSGRNGFYRPDITTAMIGGRAAAGQQRGVAAELCNFISVGAAQTGFAVIDPLEMTRRKTKARASNASYDRSNLLTRTVQCKLKDYGLESPFGDPLNRAEYSHMLDERMVKGMQLRQAHLRALEERVASIVTDVSTYSGQTFDAQDEWDDVANAIPIADVNRAKRNVENRTGVTPNTVVVNNRVFDNVRGTNDIREAVHSQGAGSAANLNAITSQMLAEAFGVGRVLVSHMYTVDASGDIVPVFSDEYAIVGYFAETDDPQEQSAIRGVYYNETGAPAMSEVQEIPTPHEAFEGLIRVNGLMDEVPAIPDLFEIIGNVTTIS